MNINMSELLKYYDTELRLKFDNEKTINHYKMALNKFLNSNSRVYRMSVNDIKEYFANFRQEYSNPYYNVLGSAVKIFYNLVLKQPQKMNWFIPIQTKPIFHDIITDNEFESILNNISQIKHKLFVLIFYSTGIRIGELLKILLEDVDVINQIIFIRSEKGGKNRYVYIHDKIIPILLQYLNEWNPTIYLFEGQKGGKYTESSIRQVIKRASKHINRNINPHLFRHTLASKTIEKEDVFFTKELLGHKSLSSTLHYNHISKDRFKYSYNPLNNISL